MRILSPLALCSCLAAGALLIAAGRPAQAVSCTTAPAMTPAARAALERAARTLGEDIAGNDTAALKTGSASFLVQDFAPVAAFVDGLKVKLHGATVTVDDLYTLNARDLTGPTNDAQFFCGSGTTPLLVTVSLGSLPPGDYALAIVHATGVEQPQQFALILQNTSPATAPPQWLLAGYFVRPLTLTGHSGIWFWEQARLLKTQGATLSAAMYYQAALYLSRAADIYTSNNYERLQQEATALNPPGLTADTPLNLSVANGQQVKVTGFSVTAEFGVLDLNVTVQVPQLGDAVASRTTTVAVMSALLAKDPDLRQNFHGLWLHLSTAGGQSYQLEQPMSSIPPA